MGSKQMMKTVARPVRFKGVGLHGGQPVAMSVLPAAAGAGIAFYRTDVEPEAALVSARYDLVVDTQLCTKLGNAAGTTVGTVEHVMAALAGCGITDAVIEIDGPEVPIMDGSSVVFVHELVKAGIRELGRPADAIRLRRPVGVIKDGKIATLKPANRFEMDFRIDFADPAIGRQSAEMVLTGDVFAAELSDCRTFGHLAEVEHLRKLGLARGGSLANAIVVDKGRVLNTEGLRHRDEFVRHKMLDAVGDLALAGAPIVARYSGVKAGHEMTNLLLRALFAQPEAWYRAPLTDDQWMAASSETAPALRGAHAMAV